MADLGDRLNEEFEHLRTLRDDLRVRVHLAKSEIRDQWEDLEKDWHRAEAKMKGVGAVSRESAQDVGQAARLLLDELREAYHRLRDLL